ncbi:MAG TPA: YjjG family noncanonical pyrimidine nucleotidase [Cyclobacteriaceae bacterium]|nr:YjjG family noncanonical pyrimidine nucleotidase [Cyclobacteriaceae bacterium]
MNKPLRKDQYTCIFFDLDHTLWDYETNSKETLHELFNAYNLTDKGVTDLESFHREFRRVNAALWVLYDAGKIGSEVIRAERFKQILETFGISNGKLCAEISHEYLYTCPKKGNLMPNALSTLDYLSDKYRLSIITNGFEEIQNTKLTSGNLHRYFDHIVTSQHAGFKKPSREIFDYTLTKNGIGCNQAVMVGDNLVTDIGGARQASIDSVFFNHEQVKHDSEIHVEINNLSELCKLL